MPLRALVGNRDIIAPLQSHEEWVNLTKEVKSRKKLLILACCGKNGFPRASKLGTKHFVHYRKIDCSWPSESEHHLMLKQEFLLGARDAGYEAKSEVSEGLWRADVLAQKGSVRIALEAQWSYQSAEETGERQRLFKDSGVRACWFFRKLPKSFEAPSEKIPAFIVRYMDGQFLACPNSNRSLPARVFVKYLLSGHVKFRENCALAQKQRLNFIFYKRRCWNCKKSSYVYSLDGVLRSRCGVNLECEYPSNIQFHPGIVRAAYNFQKTQAGQWLQLSSIKRRYIMKIGKEDMSFGCIKCGDVISTGWMRGNEMADRMKGQTREFELDVLIKSYQPSGPQKPHWCFSSSKDFC